MFWSLTAIAQDKISDVQQIKYSVYAGGLHALDVNLITDLSDAENYNTVMTAKTFGLLGKLAPWEGEFFTKGWKADSFRPEQHTSTTVFRGESETKTYSYNKDGSFNQYSETENGNEKIKDRDPSLTENTVDILTATLNTMRGIAAGQDCQSGQEIFDGKRRFKLIFNQKRETTFEKSRHNVYAGKAIECTVLVEPIAGKWHERPRGWASIQEQGRAKGSLPTVWFATMEEGQPAIPVKVRVKTDYGTLFMHLTQYKGATTSLKLDK